jgi:hypothetical protein
LALLLPGLPFANVRFAVHVHQAAQLGLEIPPQLLALADDVIE